MKTWGGSWGGLVCALALGCTTDPVPASGVRSDGGLDGGAAMDGATVDSFDPSTQCDPRTLADGGSPFASDAADPRCPLPNLIPVIQNVQLQNRVFGPGSCEVQERCTVVGNRRLLRFDLVTPNIGQGDLYLGPPVIGNRPDSRFEYGVCHGHWHFRGYADYRLQDTQGNDVALGHKQSFCLMDSSRYNGMGHNEPLHELYTCADQGIHAGWYDLYARSLDCQYVDVTDVPPGHYRLRAAINTARGITETSYDDNVATMDVDIPVETADGGMSMDPTDACPDSAPGPTRDCGWVVDRGSTCTPGQMVTVGCNDHCSPPVGNCVGNPMLRVCVGDGPCAHADAITENDDACGTQCPSVTFVCPARARFTVLTGANQAGSAYECRVELH